MLEALHVATLDQAVHLIQVALTPVFLLSGIAALLNVFAGRLARVADRLEALSDLYTACANEARPRISHEIARLHRRSFALDTAVVLGTAGAAATCVAILVLFVQALSNRVVGNILVGFFGLAIVCTLGSVAAFGLEMLMSSQAMRLRTKLHLPLLHRGHLPAGGDADDCA